jgi:ligand-binding sensor domain-containing protein
MIARITTWCIATLLYCIFAAANLLPLTSYAQEKDAVQFTHLTTANGLSQSSVVAILKDKYGFMWFGTQDGLNRYDGYKFKVYRNNPADKTSIPYNNIRCLLEDKAGNLWVGTAGGGLVLYDRDNDSFYTHWHYRT